MLKLVLLGLVVAISLTTVLSAPQQTKPVGRRPSVNPRYGGGSRPVPQPQEDCNCDNDGRVNPENPAGYDFGNPDPQAGIDTGNIEGGGGHNAGPVNTDEEIREDNQGGSDGGDGAEGYNGGTFNGGEGSQSGGDQPFGEDQINGGGGQSGGAGGDCVCVPYYQCKDGNIITDGSGIIDPRKKSHPKKELPLEEEFTPPFCGKFHVCCSDPSSVVTEKPYEHFCGIRKPSGINKRILSANKQGEAEFGEWPWQGAILKVEGEANHFQCGAVLLDEYHVLTVAHCVKKFLDYSPLPLIVRFGEWDTQNKNEFLPHEDFAISYATIHPDFKNTSLWNDMAILKLDTPVKFAPHIDTVCLPNYGENFEDQECVVTGWGKNAYQGGQYSNILREVHVPVISHHKCQELLRKTRLGNYFKLHDGFMCAGGEEDQDSCKGDGGGPMVCYRSDGTYALAGIVSWGIDCGMPYVPGVYMNVEKYLDWIKEATGQTLEKYWPQA